MIERDIFIAALQIEDVPQRDAYLDSACAGDTALRQRVDALIGAYDRAGSFMEQTPADPIVTVDQPVSDSPVLESPGTQIGPYKLLQQIGEGGMGVVYLAEQKKPVRRRVALKIIKPGMDTRQVIARFEAERQALALMDHPNIAKVLDAGATDSGRPYFVMELVGGVPITAYCDDQHLTPKERLALFIPVCHAVQHAHQKGIIHRDLKPNNILVALYDGQPVPKVIDFGVAKATNQVLTEKTMFTNLGQIVGTFEYMSPEQAQHSQLDIDTRSDIYSLGVLLYELLTSNTPFESQRLRSAGFDEMLRIIREEEPPRPSLKVSSSDALPSIAANRHYEPQKLGAAIRGDLDWIVMKSLEKDRARRYETASKFAEDIEHFLNDEPVIACPPSAGYQFRKFAKRHRAAIAVAGLLLISLLLGLVGTTWQAIRATHAERLAAARYRDAEEARQAEAKQRSLAELKTQEAEQQRKAAQAAQQVATNEAEIATAVKSFIQNDLLAQADPANEPDRNIRLRTVLDRAAERVANRFTERPVIEADIRDTIGHTYLGLGAYSEAGKHFARALEINRRERGAQHRDTIAAMNNQAGVHEFLGRYAQAEQLFAEVLRVSRKALGDEHPDTLICLNNLAWSLTMQGKYSEAEPLFKEALQTRSETLGDEHIDTLGSLNDLGTLYFRQQNYEAAQPLLETTLETRRKTLGDNHPETLTSMNNLAMLYKAQRQFNKAEPLLLEALNTRRMILGSRHPQTITSINNLAFLYSAAGRRNEAEVFYREALQAAQETLGDRHPATMQAYHNLAALYYAMDRSVDAEPLLRKLLAALEKNAPQSIRYHTTQYTLALSLMAQGKYVAAEPVLLDAYEKLRKLADNGVEAARGNVQQTIEKLAELYEAIDKPETADQWRAKLE